MDRLRVDHCTKILTAGVLILVAGAAFFCGISLRAIHCVVIPCFLGYVVMFRKDMPGRIRWYHLLYFVLFTAAIAAYLVSLDHRIPEIRVRWLELPIAVWFLSSIHIMVWLIDRIVDKILSALFGLRSGIPSRRRLHFPKNVLRILCVTAIAVPYLLAVFMVHWVKFADDTDPRRELGVEFTPVRFETADATQLEGWFIPAAGESSDSTVIITPGWGTTKACFLPYAMVLCSNGCNVLLFDLRGQGASSSHTRGFGLLETHDVLGAVHYLKQAHPQASRNIFGLGISHGAPALIHAAARDERIRAIILDSAILQPGSLPDRTRCWLPRPVDQYIGTATRVFASAILGHNLFRETNVQNDLSQIHPRPVLIFHGSGDNIADYTQAKNLYSMAKHPKKLCIVPGAGHEQVLVYMRNRYIDEIMDAFAGGLVD